MNIDKETKEAILQVQQNLKKEAKHVSLQEIESIVESQFIASALMFKKGLEVRLPKFGSFIRTHAFQSALRSKHRVEELQATLEEEYRVRIASIPNITEEEKDSIAREIEDRFEVEKKEIITEVKALYMKEEKERQEKRKQSLTFKDIQDTENISNVNNRFDKIV